MKLLPVRPRQLVALGALVILGCTSPTDPRGSLLGTFVLRSLDSKPVPALQYDNTFARYYVVAEALMFDGRGRGATTTVTRVDSIRRSFSASQNVAYRAEYAVRGDTIDFPFTCPSNALCVAPPVGWRLPNGGLVIASRTPTGFTFVKQYDQLP
jgi:hypothetical protein